ncbi:MAG: peptide chain release factor 1 [Calditrichia bacterium]|nr:peptide chain release factor 1 [Calditrichia bacterium]
MEAKIDKMRSRNKELTEELSRPEVFSDQKKFEKFAREQNELNQIINFYDQLEDLIKQIEEDEKIIESNEDEDLVAIASEEIEELNEKRSEMEEELKHLLIPKDPKDAKNAIIEIRAGTGGDEAAIFAGDLYRMYTKFCERKGLKTENLSSNISERGGFKEIIFNISGDNPYGILKFESGVHRVQRVPETETQGRIHTSAASVVILPEAEDVEIEINQNDLRVDVYRSSGPGGQSVNTTDSAVRITHVPTGIVVTCQDEKSQLKNKNKALKVLKARILDKAQREQNESITSQRRDMVAGGDRSAKIRTYNFPQGRVTDHRIKLTIYKLDKVLEGELDDFVEQLKIADRNLKLEEEEL